MKILYFSPLQNYCHIKKENKYLSPLSFDSVSFTAMKKSQFNSSEKYVIEYFKAPIEKFNNKKDFENWANNKIKEIQSLNYKARTEEATIQRKEMLKEWNNYLLKENKEYGSAFNLLILHQITSKLNDRNDTLPPVLNKGVLAETITQFKNNIDSPIKQEGLIKQYIGNLQSYYLKDENTTINVTGWIKIPSFENDTENFDKNVEKLKTLSHKSWCTKSYNAEPYLKNGDFHIYLENGKPKLGLRMEKDKIVEIQGEKNNGNIPLLYLDTLKDYINTNSIKLNNGMQNKILETENLKKIAKEVKEDLKDCIPITSKVKAKKVFEYFLINTKNKPEGLIIRNYDPMTYKGVSFSDIGINENDLLKHVYTIEGDALFIDSNATKANKLKYIYGKADFYQSKSIELNNLEHIEKTARFTQSDIKSLPNLKTINSEASFVNSKIQNLDKLEYIGSKAFFNKTEITTIPNLKTIKGTANFENSKIERMDNLENINGTANFKSSNIKSLKSLKEIDGDAEFSNTPIENLDNLERINGNADFTKTNIASIPKLKIIEGDADFRESKITNLENLIEIMKDAYFQRSEILNLKNLRTIRNNACFVDTKIEEMNNLFWIGKMADFTNSKIKRMDKLEKIYGNATLINTQITCLPRLRLITKRAFIAKCPPISLPSLEAIEKDAFISSEVAKNIDLSKIKGDIYYVK